MPVMDALRDNEPMPRVQSEKCAGGESWIVGNTTSKRCHSSAQLQYEVLKNYYEKAPLCERIVFKRTEHRSTVWVILRGHTSGGVVHPPESFVENQKLITTHDVVLLHYSAPTPKG